ncbi:MAG: hypothetical protein ACE5JD_17065, partial [Candidatus Methylomirabilia bacterium]
GSFATRSKIPRFSRSVDTGKTVYHRLSPQEARIYKAGTVEYRKLKSLLRRMQNVSRRALAREARPP